jgi:hypothetical protein
VLDRWNPYLRLLCLVLGALLLFQCIRIARPKEGLEQLSLSKDLILPKPSAATNAIAGTPGTKGTNLAVTRVTSRPGTEVPPQAQKRIDRIIESEIFGPVPRPLPMALLGIAGQHAFLRAPNGQTGLVREGEELGGVKVLKIGANRVLVEQDKEQKELMIFSGLGGETLLPKGEKIEKTTQPAN